ncbi:hypothetical protein ACP4J4_01740 [Aureimonas ureilytica]|uniref:hypothetical protein n=1 Tax=Aureimonas ureilytica TaxID=401562 RepID=UPI003CF626CA
MSRITPLDRDISLILDDLTSPEARSARLAEFAAEQIAEVREANRASSGGEARYEQIVDGRKGAALTSVRPNGVIVANFDIVREVLDWIGDALVRASPVLSGRFARSFMILADGVEVPQGGDLPAAEEYAFTNAQPYTRRLERGASRQSPDGVFEGVASVAARQFGNSARVTFGFRTLEGSSAMDAWATRTSLHKRQKRQLSYPQEWLRRQPAVIVRPF